MNSKILKQSLVLWTMYSLPWIAATFLWIFMIAMLLDVMEQLMMGSISQAAATGTNSSPSGVFPIVFLLVSTLVAIATFFGVSKLARKLLARPFALMVAEYRDS